MFKVLNILIYNNFKMYFSIISVRKYIYANKIELLKNKDR